MARHGAVFLLFLLWAGGALAAGPDDTLLQKLSTVRGEERARLLNELSAEARSNAPAEAIEWARQALELAGQIDDPTGTARALNNIGIGHYLQAEYDLALQYYDRALAVAEASGDDEGLASTLNNIGVVHYIRGHYEQTIEYYARTLELRRRIGDRIPLAQVSNNLGNVYYTAKRHDDALESYAEAVRIYADSGNESAHANSLCNMALVYMELGRLDEAQQRLELALDIGQRVDHKPTLALALNSLGDIASQQRRFNDALRHHRGALDVRRQIGDRLGEADTLLSIGQTYVSLAEYPRARDVLSDVLVLASEIGVREIQRDAYEALAESLAGSGDFEGALEAHQAFKRVTDALFDEEISRRLSDIKTQNELFAKDQEIAGLQARERLVQRTRNISAAAAVLLLLLIFLLHNRYRLSRRAHEASRLAQAERENAARAELAHVARVSTLGEMAAALAHELNQPLTAILSNAETTRRLVGEDRASKAHLTDALEDIVIGAGRAREIIRRLRRLVQRGVVAREKLSINDIVRDVEALAKSNAKNHGIELRADLDDNLPAVEGDPVQLQQVVLNLVNNATAAMAGGTVKGELLITTARHEPGHVMVAVSDHGPAVDEQVFARMFQPFFSTKQDGLGMGLAICQNIVEAHHGRIWAERNPAGGLTMRVALPA